MKNKFEMIFSIAMYYIFILSFVNEVIIIDEFSFKFMLACGIVILITSGLFITRGFQLWVSIICLLIGNILIFTNRLNLDVWYNSITKLSAIVVLFAAIPMISFPVKYGNYLNSIESFIAKNKDRPSFLIIILSIFHTFLALVLDIGSIPTMHKLIGHINLPEKYYSRMYTSGYASFVVFSPYSGLVNLLLILAGTTYASFFIGGCIMFFIIVSVTAIFIYYDKKLVSEVKNSICITRKNLSMKKIYELETGLILLILLAIVAGELIPVSNVIYAIALILLLYSLIWGFLLDVMSSYAREFTNYNKNILVYKSILPFLICTGFLGGIISETNLNSSIQLLVAQLSSFPLYFAVLVPIFITMICSICGIHMMIPVITMAMTLTPSSIGLSPPAFVLMLLSSWFVAMSITPFAPFAALVSETVGEKITNITFKYNLPFAICMLFLAPAIIMLVNLITYHS